MEDAKMELKETELEQVNGGLWIPNGSIIKDIKIYRSAGIDVGVDGEGLTFKCSVGNKRVGIKNEKTAAAIAFYAYSHDGSRPESLSQALNFRTNNVDAYKEYINNINN